MAWVDIFWNYDDPDGNVTHIAEHGLITDDVEHALEHPIGESVSDSSGRPAVYGLALDGRLIYVIYELVDEVTVYPITAYEVEE